MSLSNTPPNENRCQMSVKSDNVLRMYPGSSELLKMMDPRALDVVVRGPSYCQRPSVSYLLVALIFALLCDPPMLASLCQAILTPCSHGGHQLTNPHPRGNQSKLSSRIPELGLRPISALSRGSIPKAVFSEQSIRDLCMIH